MPASKQRLDGQRLISEFTRVSDRGAFMGIGVSLILIAAGAILAFAVHASSSTYNVHTVGAILIVVGAIGLVASMVLFQSGLRRGQGDTHYNRRAVGDLTCHSRSQERATA